MTDLDKREKVIRGLQEAVDWLSTETSLTVIDQWVVRDALALLKAQEPRVMTWEEAKVNANEGPFIILEVRDSTGTEIDYGVLVDDSYEMSEGSMLTVCDFEMLEDDYNKRFRCWTSQPNDDQREAVKWE